MKILLDESVPWPMHDMLAGHDCTNVQRRGWAGVKNGELLRLAGAEFDLFITCDQGIRYQQNLLHGSIAILSFRQMISGVFALPRLQSQRCERMNFKILRFPDVTTLRPRSIWLRCPSPAHGSARRWRWRRLGLRNGDNCAD